MGWIECGGAERGRGGILHAEGLGPSNPNPPVVISAPSCIPAAIIMEVPSHSWAWVAQASTSAQGASQDNAAAVSDVVAPQSFIVRHMPMHMSLSVVVTKLGVWRVRWGTQWRPQGSSESPLSLPSRVAPVAKNGRGWVRRTT